MQALSAEVAGSGTVARREHCVATIHPSRGVLASRVAKCPDHSDRGDSLVSAS